MADSWQQHVLNNMLPRMEATTEQATSFLPAPANPQPLSLGIGFQQPQFDVIDLLPEDRKEFLRLMRDRSSEKYAATIPFETIRTASERVTGAANDLKRLTDSRLHVKPDDRQVTAAQRALAEAKDDLERTKQRSEKLTAAWHAAGAALPNFESWLRDGRPHGTVLEAVEVEVPKPSKGEGGLLDQIENRRRRVRELKADVHRIQSAPYPSSHAKAQMREIVEQAAVRGTPEVSLLIEHDRREIGWPMARVRSEVLGTQGHSLFMKRSMSSGFSRFCSSRL